MINYDYSRFVESLFKPGTREEQLLHGAMGVAGEAGEIVDCIKKHIFYEQPLDRENLIEEIGDTLFYLQALANLIDMPGLEDIILCNAEKLMERYPNGYSNEDAKARKDKQ